MALHYYLSEKLIFFVRIQIVTIKIPEHIFVEIIELPIHGKARDPFTLANELMTVTDFLNVTEICQMINLHLQEEDVTTLFFLLAKIVAKLYISSYLFDINELFTTYLEPVIEFLEMFPDIALVCAYIFVFTV